MTNDNVSTTNIFRILRTCMGLSLKEMAKKCKVSAVYLGELELGKKAKPSDDIIQRIANACGINARTIHYFLEQQKGESLNYQRYLLSSLERLAEKTQYDTAEEATDN